MRSREHAHLTPMNFRKTPHADKETGKVNVKINT